MPITCITEFLWLCQLVVAAVGLTVILFCVSSSFSLVSNLGFMFLIFVLFGVINVKHLPHCNVVSYRLSLEQRKVNVHAMAVRHCDEPQAVLWIRILVGVSGWKNCTVQSCHVVATGCCAQKHTQIRNKRYDNSSFSRKIFMADDQQWGSATSSY